MAAALRILADVVGYRLRRLEMANLAGAVAIMLALRLEWADLVWRAGFGALLNVLVYLNNDYRDVALDARSPDREPATVDFLRTHAREAMALQWGLAALLASLAVAHSPGLVLAGVLGGGTCWAYSKHLKPIPYVDVVAMTMWGFAMPLCAVPLDSALGLCLALQLGLYSSVFECIQVIRDRDVDAALGLRTTAVVLGVARTLHLARALTLLVALYAALFIHPVSGGIAACALLLPWRDGQATRYWTAVKLVFGLAWLVACTSVYLDGTSSGLWLRLGAHTTLGGL